MNRGVLQTSPVQQLMAAENSNWWSINNLNQPISTHHPQGSLLPSSLLSSPAHPPFLYPQPSNQQSHNSSYSSSSLSGPVTWSGIGNPEQFPESLSQLLLGGFVGEEDVESIGLFLSKKNENLGDRASTFHQVDVSRETNSCVVDVKLETSPPRGYGYVHASDDFVRSVSSKTVWPVSMVATSTTNSSPNSCVTALPNGCQSTLEFASSKRKTDPKHPTPDRSSDCSSNSYGGVLKRPRTQPSSQPALKGRKEKLGDRINALHQLVSPFGKTDTASVLLEAIGYIRFLQNQIEALSLPYLGNGSSNLSREHSEDKSCVFGEEPGQRNNSNQSHRSLDTGDVEPRRDLKSRGLCLVPVSSTNHVGSENGADYWAPAFGGGFR